MRVEDEHCPHTDSGYCKNCVNALLKENYDPWVWATGGLWKVVDIMNGFLAAKVPIRIGSMAKISEARRLIVQLEIDVNAAIANNRTEANGDQPPVEEKAKASG